MGNSQTKESRGHAGSLSRHGSGTGSPSIGQDPSSNPESNVRPTQHTRRGSRHDFSFLGLGGSNEQDTTSLEQRRENKVEREARKAEKERQARLKERERSMKEEHVDGGYLVTQGVYVGPEDYSKPTVRQFMIERRLAPFWRGLNDYSESWAEHQLMAAARGMPIPPADHVPPELEYTLTKSRPSDAKVKGMTIPINSRSHSYQSDQSQTMSPPNNNSLPSPPLPGSSTSPTAPLFRARAKTLASLTSSRHNGSADATPREFQLPPDQFVNGQPIEVYLYKDASECPICFLYYPPYLNTTRCCEQPICSECFVQIKRPDPHPPEHEQPDPNAPPVSEEERLAQAEGLLVSEVATCPYCKQPEFGITYVPPPFRRGLTYGSGTQPHQTMSPMSSQTSLSSGQMSPNPNRRRGTSISASAPEVITTDKVRPDWASKLHAARAHAARRSAAATALHTAAYLMGPQDRSSFPGFGRRGMRRSTLDGEQSTEAQRHAMAFLADRQSPVQSGNAMLPPPRGSSSRRTRIDDIEELMMIEAIRMSLASEEERRKKEEKEAKKKAKKDEKENRKAEKAARKNSLLSSQPTTNGESSAVPLERSLSSNSSLFPEEPSTKGKEVERTGEGVEDDQVHQPPSISSLQSQDSLSSGMPIPLGSEPFRRSHLRQMSNASSASSSFAETGVNYSASGTPPGNAPNEPMFNFRSLTAMISEDEKADGSASTEHQEGEIGRQPSLENLDERPLAAGSSPLAQSESIESGSDYGHKKPGILIESANTHVSDKSKSL